MITQPAKLWCINADLDAADRYGTNMSTCNQSVPLAESQIHVINPANACGALDNRVKHRLHVCGRAADNGEHFRCCRLMLQGLAQFCVALLNLFEQSHVLDRYHRLIGESLQEFDLFVCEWPHFESTNQN